ncbi:glycoside hydrolase family 94 protein [Leeia oryzae]|uniref:glycoside hydrolase family 94 protein n=1 Tax=Leeia oryzae TaxID=356662 RepID=UPI0009FD54F6|nr:glycoside hydrolase family 94 protein [Leeia oryzae]
MTLLRRGRWSPASPEEEPPLRSELLSAEQMARHGKALAALHPLASGSAPDLLLPRLAANEAALISVCDVLMLSGAHKRRSTPAGGWLLDNFYLIEEQIRTAKRHLPRGYSRELPRLAHGPSAGRPRVYDIALEMVSHGDGRVDTESLSRFVTAYQSVTPLKLGELWAIPIMLRLAVIENLRRVGMQIAIGANERHLADVWADKMIAMAEQDPKNLILVIADMAHSGPPMVSAFVAELARRLQGRGPALALPLNWIEQRLAESGMTIEQLVQLENQQQAADQVSISNSIGSLRVLGAMDWREFVETMSLVEQTLLDDPSDVYRHMDFATRDRYRHATEAIARQGQLAEIEVAHKAVALARAGAGHPDSVGERAGHVGFYLLDKGLPMLEEAAGVRLPYTEVCRRWLGRVPLLLYLGGITLLTAIMTVTMLMQMAAAGVPDALLWLTGGCLLLAGSQLAVALVNWLATLLVIPHALSRMDYTTGIPAHARTLVVVPTMLTSAANVDKLIEDLEVRFLANRDDSLHFGLLTDVRDAPQEILPEDAQLVALASNRIDELNEKYGHAEGRVTDDIFFLFHRARRWNPQEKIWMGYERKRGKLADLNALLRTDKQGGGREAFSRIVGNIGILSSVKYVITLDTDTQLPRDVARQFIAAMAHPLNQPYYHETKQRITEGYGILQPRVAISLPGTNRSRYARLYGGEPGIDPYTRVVSDVYQDVFGEGSFIGKGIYDVDAFELALGGRFPENHVLSHDLLEGCHARAGLLSDVQLYEEYPARYHADVSRRHRWIRGDWQLAGWLLRRVPCQWRAIGSQRRRNPLSALSQWKLMDNLRRSLVPTALTLLLLLGWMTLPSAWGWTAAVIGILLAPVWCAAMLDLIRKPDDVLFRQHLAVIVHSLVRHFMQFLFELACLPYEAFYTLDAILRTSWRMLVIRKRLLEWTPSNEAEHHWARRNGLLASYRAMWFAPLLATSACVLMTVIAPQALIVAAPILLLWFAAPGIAWWISRPLVRRDAALTLAQILFLRALTRRTWAFFDTFVGPADHWLPPDNYQEYRVAAIAHRTSPTNIGLALLANLTAYDFGYLPSGKLIERTTQTLDTMGTMERFRGHFYNWYDTETLALLPPLYISTVDSGNLAAHLLTLRAGLAVLDDDRIIHPRLFDGLSDTLNLFNDTAAGVAAASLIMFRRELSVAALAPPKYFGDAYQCLTRLSRMAVELAEHVLMGVVAKSDETLESQNNRQDATVWATALERQCQEALDELTYLAPWLLLPAAPDALHTLRDMTQLTAIPTLRGLTSLDAEWRPEIMRCFASAVTMEERDWLIELQTSLATGVARARARLDAMDQLAGRCLEFAEMKYDFLFDKTRHLLSIGYNVAEHRADPGYYDLLASEARLGCFVGIAQGQLPQESWFALGRLLTSTGGDPVLLSWSGSMFEYLMPQLIMPTYDNTLLDQTCKAMVARQIEYGKQRGVPWGMSESGYNMVDVNLNYQYRAFGVPGLGLKRGLAEDLVVAPYASVLALVVMPEAACRNLQKMAAAGFVGQFGFFEAIDYTPARQRRGQSSVVVRSFMSHHQGMSLLALSYLLLHQPMQRRFESDRLFQAVMPLLQERIPRTTTLFPHTARRFDVHTAWTANQTPIRIYSTPDTPIPEVQLLSNGRFHVMVTNAGGGYSRWKDLAVTRWREDGTRDNWGSFCYIRDLASGTYWSSNYQPTLVQPDHFEAIFAEGRAEFRRRDKVANGDVETHTEMVVSPEDDIELRRIHLTNRSSQRREIDITSYADVVLAPPAADASHPAFSNLFVQTEILPVQHAILCTRRPRSSDDQVPWMLHLIALHDAHVSDVSYETDRLRFIGRTRTPVAPLAMEDDHALSGTDGSVLDPIVAIRCLVVLEPDESIVVDVVTGMAETRVAAMALVEKYQDRHLADRVFDLAWTHSQVALRQLNATEADAELYARLASRVIYADMALRADAAVLVQNRRGQSGLWGYAISGDLPIVLLQIADAGNIDLVRQMVQAHAYWRLRGLAVDLVIWNESHAGYRQNLQDQIMGLIASGIDASVIDRPGGVFVRPAEQIATEDRILIQSVARVIITDSRGSLAEQLDRRPPAEPRAPKLVPSRQRRLETYPDISLPQWPLHLANGLGGFSADSREYVMTLAPDEVTPAPWVNVLANPHFGTVISESGMAYSWRENAHEYRLTPWHNDPVSDTGGEALYLRDEETGSVWSPAPLPVRADSPYVVRHGFGYSVFETCHDGICSELWVYVATDAPVKFSVLKLRNASARLRKLSATGYVEWVLGDQRAKSAMHVMTEVDAQSGALFARNPYNTEFADRVAFFDLDEPGRTLTGDRLEFLGRNGTQQRPAALKRTRLSGKVGAGLDPCAALQTGIELAVGQTREIIFRLGAGRDAADAARLVKRFRGALAAKDALEAVHLQWQHTLGAVQIETPDPAIDTLANGWLVYQTLACRIWARSGYYQSGGAFGFRDQLQDMMALVHTQPALLREHLLLCASRQFKEGDVQHWWHPPAGRGVRTHCSDDYLWLALAVCRYVSCTGDTGVLHEQVHFLEGRPVSPDDDSYYDLPHQSIEMDSLYQHAVRAIRHGMRFGAHGLPLMGSGDWNDGMNLVGLHGKGESVWLGFFLCDVLRQFEGLARAHGDAIFADHCQQEHGELRLRIEQHGWDGEWYRRAYFDDGTPLGSASNSECRIDSISQSWSVLSGAGDVNRSRMAMQAVNTHLVRDEDALIQLLDPPFDTAALNPGYIRGYVPGVRENGGQYTHGAIWAAMAYAALGERERAWALLDMINPVNHSQTRQQADTYKAEPYVVAADVYALSPHTGRGGWSWYTGSAGWLYRLIVESLLGLRLEADRLYLVPCLPADWPACKIHYRYRATTYHMVITQLSGDAEGNVSGMQVTVDGIRQPASWILLQDDQVDHQVSVVICLPTMVPVGTGGER